MGATVLIRVDGTPERGLGHVVRMQRLAAGLGARGHRIAFATIAGTLGERVLGEAGLLCHPLASAEPASFAALVAEQAPRLVIFDVLDTDAALMDAAGGRPVLCFDDCGAGLARAAAVINPIVFHWGRYAVADCRARLYEGPAYMILPPEIAALRDGRGGPERPGLRLLLAFGGTDTHGVTPRMVENLNRAAPPLSLRINLGPGAAPSAALDRAVAGSPHAIQVLDGVPSLLAEFAAADLVVCGGGIMLYELAALGVPAAALATEDHEAVNIAWFTARGTAIDLGHHHALAAAEAARRLVETLTDRSARAGLAGAGPALVDGRGLERCVTVVEDLAR